MQKLGRKTFKQIVAEVAPINIRRLIAKAILANRIAKLQMIRGRSQAYRLKGSVLWKLQRLVPSRVFPDSERTSADILVFVIPRYRFQIHIGSWQLSPPGQPDDVNY
ncbi:MAG TPA: hypothetical protein PKZ53_11065 [Acidobacteriota bacterium]|nr:hypothetical protein [Acidobacteriota bacterium]HNJ41021.1 hypothetical protein [Acidobacteriota bacterium]